MQTAAASGPRRVGLSELPETAPSDPTGPRFLVEDIYPRVDGGRYPLKRITGEPIEVWADLLRDGHDQLAAELLWRRESETDWRREPMLLAGNDRWHGQFTPPEPGRYLFAVEAWTDQFATWRKGVLLHREAGHALTLEAQEGRELLGELNVRDASIKRIIDRARRQFDRVPDIETLLADELAEAVALSDPRGDLTRSIAIPVVVDRPRARAGAWYEMVPRSQGTVPGKHGTFDDCIARLPDIAALGFDVVYLTPIHPIGMTNRKGKNNSLKAAPDDPGSPYAIGSWQGGHDAVHPELGTLDDFRRFVDACRGLNMEVALDFAIQCSPDHPWLREHPEWFRRRPDGSIRYAENPPKKYEDIVNPDFYYADREALWTALRDVVLFWVEQGVRIFRVDNPHTKPFPFWEWLIREVQERDPGTVFLSEAFTRPKVMKALAKLGFTQSYTYFTWRNHKQEIIEYLTELTQDWPKEYMRPNFFLNTHDILPHILQFGGRPAFQMRFVLAATLSSTYGIYSGFELCENTPRGEPGTTVYYQDSEVYEYKVRDWDRPGNIKDYIKRINEIRRDNPALHYLKNLSFYEAPNDNILFYGKRTGDNAVFVAVNLDPDVAHDTHVQFPLWEFGIGETEGYVVEELITGREMPATGSWFWVRLDPESSPAEIFRLRKAGVR